VNKYRFVLQGPLTGKLIRYNSALLHLSCAAMMVCRPWERKWLHLTAGHYPSVGSKKNFESRRIWVTREWSFWVRATQSAEFGVWPYSPFAVG